MPYVPMCVAHLMVKLRKSDTSGNTTREVVTDIINNKHMKVSTLDHMQYYAGRMDPPQKSPDKMVTKC